MMLLFVEASTDTVQKPLSSSCVGFISCDLLCVFITTNRFVCVYNLHGFLLIRSYCLQTRDNFASFFPTWMTYFTLFFLIALANTLYILLNRSGKGRNLVSILISEEKLSVSMRLAVSCSHIAFLKVR